jgi:predicted nuclease of predicted toxin-antitoxin system
MKLLVDMNLSPQWVPLLINAGWEAVHWSSVGKGNAPDSEIMSYAKQQDYVVITHDMDFSAILAATHGEKPSVVQIRIEDVSPSSGDRIVAALRHLQTELELGALVTIGANRSRVRMLPLPRKPQRGT